MLDRRKFERGLKKIRFFSRKKKSESVSKIEGKIASKAELGYKFKLCQFESSLPRQTAKNRLYTAILVEISSSTMRETGPPSLSIPLLSFFSPFAFALRRANLTDATFPFPRPTRIARLFFRREILEDGQKGLENPTFPQGIPIFRSFPSLDTIDA